MAKNTTNYNLLKPELTDAADITKMNGNWDIVDQQLKLNQTKVTELEQEVDSKIGDLDVYSKGEVDTALGKKANTSDVYSKTEADTLLAKKANTSDLNSKASATDITNALNDKITYGTTDLTAGTSPLATGKLYFVYE